MANKHIKRCSISLAIRGMQINTTMRYQYPPIKMPKIKKKKTGTIQNAGENSEELDYSYIVGRNVK